MKNSIFRIPYDDLCDIADSIHTHLDEFRGKTFLLVGGTGFLGKWVFGALIFINNKFNLKIKIIVVTRSIKNLLAKYPEISKYDFIELVESDITNMNEKFSSDFVFYAASDVTDEFIKNKKLMEKTIIDGTDNLLNSIDLTKIKSFTHISSGAVNNYLIDNAKTEVNNYGRCKYLAERKIIQIGEKNSFITQNLRCYTFIGPLMPLNTHFAAGNFLSNALKGEDISINGDGSPLRSYLYTSDFSSFVLKSFFLENSNDFDIGSNEAISILDLAKKITNVSDKQIELIVKSQKQKILKINKYLPNTDKMGELNLVPRISLNEALRKTSNFYKEINHL
tara:strand:+ start:1814 stop:2821 length:1008 start_codon:yes stop_codon:yes gene_type:complete